MNVKFLIDECTGKRLAVLLKKANDEERILITDDKDFGEFVFRLEKPSSGVILIRTSTTNPPKRFDLLEILLKSTDVDRKFIVLKDGVIKVRDT